MTTGSTVIFFQINIKRCFTHIQEYPKTIHLSEDIMAINFVFWGNQCQPPLFSCVGVQTAKCLHTWQKKTHLKIDHQSKQRSYRMNIYAKKVMGTKLLRDLVRIWNCGCLVFMESFLFKYRSHALKSRTSYGNSALFLKRSQYISLDFHVLRKSQKAKCSS